jgi:two-component system nitrate/nitrite response regulator NarL
MVALSRLTVGLAQDLHDHILAPILILSRSALKKSPRNCGARKEIVRIRKNGERVRNMVQALLWLLADNTKAQIERVSNEGGLDAPAELYRLLSRRERDVLGGVTRGLSNKEIARELGLVEATVKLHLRGAFRKIGVRSRTEAAVKVTKAGFA